jgi:aminoglycoside phosphotransferase (APT) family kinase protein
MSDQLRRTPPETTLRWAARAIGRGSKVVSVRRLRQGGWHANHALTIVDRRGTRHRLVLRRWSRPGWASEDPDFTPTRELAALELLSGSPVPTPRAVAADPHAAICDVPTLLLTRLPGHPPGLPGDMNAFLGQLADALAAIHAVDRPALERIPNYRGYHDLGSASPPAWSPRTRLWELAIELAQATPSRGRACFIHRDYHPENTLWTRGRLTGVVDWTSASRGSAAVDTAHMRWNLALTYGIDVADEFLRAHRALTGANLDDQTYWDVVTVLDLVHDLDPAGRPRFDLERLDGYLERVLVRGT